MITTILLEEDEEN